MKKYSKILILLLVPFLLTACVKKPQNMEGNGQNDQAMENDNGDSSFTGTVMDLLSMGKSMKCTAKYAAEGVENNYTMYTMGDKVYSEMEVDMGAEGKISQRSLMAGDMVYTWNPETNMGTKMSLKEFEDVDVDADVETPEEQDSSYKDFKQEFDYNCKAWVPNPSLFSPPSDIEFVDMTAMMKDMQESLENGDMGGMQEAACAACNNMPEGETRNECLASLGCN
jgi:predicted small secreted protein